MKILTEKQDALLKDERSLLNDLRVALVQFDATPEDHETITDSIEQLDELFLLVVVGEFNAGKSAFINALLGQRVLKEGVTPTTTQINILRYGEDSSRLVENEHVHMVVAPVEFLQEISIVDTPGTNAIIREHEEITQKFVPRSDLVLFITSTDRPFTESERAFLEHIRSWGKKVVVVINKTDLVQGEEELAQIRSFVVDNASRLFGMTPEVFPVSARLAMRAKDGDPSVWDASRFEALERYIYETLDESGRVRLKFLNPLGVGEHLVGKYLEVTEGRLTLLRSDFSMLEDVEAQLKLYREDMQRDFNFRMADIENILFEMEQRGQDFFDDTIRIGRVFDLINKSRIQAEFEQKVVADSPQRVEQKVSELIDWLVDSDLRQWQAVMDHLAERRREHAGRIVGDVGIGSFHYDRDRLIAGVGREAGRVVETYDKVHEAELIAEGAQNAVAATAAMEVGAIGLGTLVTILATTAAADITGLLLASTIAAIGLFVLPARRRQAKIEMREKIAELRESLVGTLRGQFQREIDRSLQRINEAIGPYTRFVRAERDKLQTAQTELDRIREGLGRLRVRVDDLEQ